jgi:hypothetical protein
MDTSRRNMSLVKRPSFETEVSFLKTVTEEWKIYGFQYA